MSSIAENQATAADSSADAQAIRGTSAVLPLSDLLQVVEAGRRSGVLELSENGVSATVWLANGRVCDATTSDGERGASALYRLLAWSNARFQLSFEPVERPVRVAGTISALLLEAARRADEANRPDEPAPPHAALPDPPPPPPVEVRAAHRALTLLNVFAADALSVAEPAYLAGVFESTRESLLGQLDVLGRFRVTETAQVFLEGTPEASAVVEATATWIEAVRRRLDSSFPGRFRRQRLRRLTEAVKDDLDELGFIDALGLGNEPREKPI